MTGTALPAGGLFRRAAPLLLLLASSCRTGEPPPGVYADIFTEKGRIRARLEPERTPLAVASFVGLAEGAIENAAFDADRPFFDGTRFHRVEPGHVIQGGIPDSERAGGPGFVFPNEIHAELSHDHAGALNLANGGPHTNGSQFCITLGDRSYLDGDYIVFGEVVDGMDIVFSVTRGDRVDSVRIVRVGAEAESYRPTTEAFREMVLAAWERVAAHAEGKARLEAAWIEEHYPGLQGSEGGVRWARIRPPQRSRAESDTLRVRYRGHRVRYVGHLLGQAGDSLEVTAFGSGEEGVPGFVEPPLPFPFVPGVSTVTPGVDSMLAEMGPGEARIVVVPAELGYGVEGLYPRETPGEPRFVVSPNTLLVYELEVLGDP